MSRASNTIDRRSKDLVEITRRTGESIKGLWVDDADPTIIPNVKGAMQPFKLQDAPIVPEGMRLQDMRKFYTTTTLIVEDKKARGDLVKFDGVTYRVTGIANWTARGYNKYILAKVS